MPSFGPKSKQCRAELHPDLQRVVDRAIKKIDFSIICGRRGEKEQEEAFTKGNSKAHFGQSPHNKSPSAAFDFVPVPCDWDNLEAFRKVVDVIKECAKEEIVHINCGIDWKKFADSPHIELDGWES
jgi:hypothetical protein